MNADEQLHEAIQERIRIENTFFNLLKTAIKDAVDRFDQCDTSTSPEVEDSVNLSMDGLTEAIRKLKEETVLNEKTANSIKDWFSTVAQDNHLVQDSKLATSSTPTRSLADRARGLFGFSSVPAAQPPPGSAAPRPFLNPLQFWQNPQTAPAWQKVMENHNNPNKFNDKVIFPIGGKRKTRKYRRKV